MRTPDEMPREGVSIDFLTPRVSYETRDRLDAVNARITEKNQHVVLATLADALQDAYLRWLAETERALEIEVTK